MVPMQSALPPEVKVKDKAIDKTKVATVTIINKATASKLRKIEMPYEFDTAVAPESFEFKGC